jgi:hypothetical protein
VRDDGRALRLLIAAGAGIPEHYLAEGGNANRATAAEMGLPAIKRFQRRQEYFRQVLVRIVSRVIDEAQRVGRLGPRVNRSIRVEFEELSPSPVEALAAAAGGLAPALAAAAERSWLTPEECRGLLLRVLGQAESR